MHYANGQEAKAGDLVFKSSKASYDNEIIGILVSAQAGSTSCNGQVATVLMRGKSDCGDSPWLPVAGGGNTWCVTVGDLLPVAMPTLPDPPVTDAPSGDAPPVS